MVTEDLEDPEWEISDDCRQKSHQIFRKRFTRVWIKRLLRRNEKDRPSVPRSTSFPRGGTKKTVPPFHESGRGKVILDIIKYSLYSINNIDQLII